MARGAWLRDGTCDVTQGGNNVSFSGVQLLLAGVNIGSIFVAPDGGLYEINAVSNDSISIISLSGGTYSGSTATGQRYAIVINFTNTTPAKLALSVSNQISDWQTYLDQFSVFQVGNSEGGALLPAKTCLVGNILATQYDSQTSCEAASGTWYEDATQLNNGHYLLRDALGVERLFIGATVASLSIQNILDDIEGIRAAIDNIEDWAKKGNSSSPPRSKLRGYANYRGEYAAATIYQRGDIVLQGGRLFINIEIIGAGTQGITPDDAVAAAGIWEPFSKPTDFTDISSEIDHLQALTHEISLGAPGEWETASIGGVYIGARGQNASQLATRAFADNLTAPFTRAPVVIYVAIPSVAAGDPHFRLSIVGQSPSSAYRIPLNQWISLGVDTAGTHYYAATQETTLGTDDTAIRLEQYADQGGTTFSGKVDRIEDWANKGNLDRVPLAKQHRARLGWVDIFPRFTVTTGTTKTFTVAETEAFFNFLRNGGDSIIRLARAVETAPNAPPISGFSDNINALFTAPAVTDTDSGWPIRFRVTTRRGDANLLIQNIGIGLQMTMDIPSGNTGNDISVNGNKPLVFQYQSIVYDEA